MKTKHAFTIRWRMRHIKFCLLAIIIVTISLFAVVVNADPKFSEGIIDFGGTDIFLRPDSSTPVVYTLKEGSNIGVYSEEGDYARIVFGNYRGYVKRDKIFIPTEDTYEASIYGSGVRLRMGPGAFSMVVAELKEEAQVEINSVSGDWYAVNVSIDNEMIAGYVAREYVLITRDKDASIILKPEMEGASVKTLQIELKKRGFLIATATGYYGPATKQAVGNFQVAANLSPDGIAGQDTLDMLYADNDIKAAPIVVASNNNGSSSGGSSSSGNRINFYTSNGTADALARLGTVRSLYYTNAYGVFPVGTSATITIVATGQSFNIKRNTGTRSSPHADVEPKTANDAAVLKSALGGRYVSARCPVWITIGGKTYAASIYSVPHADHLSKIGNNNFPGVFCVHFIDSRGNSSGVVDSDHQAAIAFALAAAD